ncbi:MAG TPA: hypothetical protein VMT43_02510 [Acidimicrobiales bacterium]|nr:hypothetical protein [Acidimicrobiales bacterium]
MTDLLPDLESQLERYGALLRDELARSVPAVALDRRHASLPRLVLAAAVIVFVALVGAAVVVSRPSRPAGRTPTTRPTSTSTTIAPGQDPHRTAAEAAAAALLTRVRPGLGWTRVAAAPVAILAKPLETPMTPNLVQRTRFWVAPATWRDVDAYITSHAVPGVVSGGSGSTSDHGVTTARGIDFGPAGFSTEPGLRQQWLRFETAQLADGRVGVRADAQVIWIPSRPASEAVPTGEAAVTITATWGFGTGAGHQTRTIHDRTTIDGLASLLNSLDVADAGPGGCVMDQNLRLTLRFTGSSPVDTVIAEGDPSCFETSFTRGGVAGPALASGSRLFDREAEALGTTMNALEARAMAASSGLPPTTTSTTR